MGGMMKEMSRMASWREEIKKLESCPQRQDSTTEQMMDLHSVANKLGFYDAADYINRMFIERHLDTKSETFQVWEWNTEESDFPKTTAKVIDEGLSWAEANKLCKKYPKHFIRRVMEE